MFESTFDGKEENDEWYFPLTLAFFLKIKLSETGPPFSEVKGEGLITCDTITNRRSQNTLFTIESVHFIKADHCARFYELLMLWIRQAS
jgi:hypothetical protein